MLCISQLRTQSLHVDLGEEQQSNAVIYVWLVNSYWKNNQYCAVCPPEMETVLNIW